MMYKKIYVIIFCATFAALSVAENRKNSLVGFQSIPWLSSPQVVNERIPKSYVRDSCQEQGKKNEGKLKQIYKKENSSCKSVIVDEYMVDNIKFSLTAFFNYQNQLKNVWLYFSPPLSSSETESVEECDLAYQKILNLLEIRYGESTGVNNGSPYWLFEKFEMRAWVLNPTEIWIRKSYSKKSSDSVIGCNVEVNYGPRISEEASKL
jgi:hypothetical protein